jgi:Amt family ammonium transporter
VRLERGRRGKAIPGTQLTAFSDIDAMWLLVCTILVVLMQAGFACLECGLVRAKNSVNVAMKNLTDFLVSSLLFWAFGFAIMFGASQWGLFGLGSFGIVRGDVISPAQGALTAFFFFQMAFCGTATTIVSGAVAERISFAGYIVISALVSGIIYPIFGHWAWGGIAAGVPSGWLEQLGFIDFAGSTVVHSIGGWVGLAAVLTVGVRIGRSTIPRTAGHNPPIRSRRVPAVGRLVRLQWRQHAGAE